MTGTQKITAADHGTWLDGAHGWTNGYRCIQRALSFGWTIPEEYREGWNQFVNSLNGDADHDLWHDANGDDGGFVDAATEYLQELAPENFVFRWDMGELSLLPVWVDCEADGGGCESNEGHNGETFVTPCPDHRPEHKIRVSPHVLADGFTSYTVMLWDEAGEVLSGSEEITFTPRPAYGTVDTGEFWFPEVIVNKRIREVAERLIRRTRCEGHVNDDAALTSGAGIGETVYCDGSCA